ncbi:major capsid protein [Verminephrobacter aporrectodeae subsp. tuberculatae]|uniref:Major capsid protein n=1 Tax=Verminephrobacter aporrectodeae subsp. tuberculatae TaxID=1110392 RepID=A0ABT3KMU9_9BURK|nr:major capsid protein [Verminephrobacter aporrectodeae]MCW5319634.1 major capsid protein [Verminephrobacter aporrectodeae subsp. tuberculatae]
MAAITIFEDDAFSVSTLTATINDKPEVPGRIGGLRLFDEEGVSSTTVQIEKDGDTLALVPAGQRGQPATPVHGSKRQMIPFNTIHLAQRASINADEVQGIRAFGTETELTAVESLVTKRLLKMRRQLDATHEFHRIGAIKGLVLDADGSTVLLNLFDRFGIAQQTFRFDLDTATTELRLKCGDVLDLIEDALSGQTFSGVRVLCGKDFWRKLVVHKSIKETYLNTQMAGALRGDPREAFEFGGCVFERYRGKVGSIAFIGDAEAYAVPEGVPELFITRYAPADYMETVNTNGLPYYAKQERMPFDKGVLLESQSNSINLCTRPRAIIKLTV